MNFAEWYERGLVYDDFLAKYATDEQRRRWESVRSQVVLTDAQAELLRQFRREMKVLVVAGAWCGDCVNQCPIFAQFTDVARKIQLRFFDRDDCSELASELAICGAPRVPSVLFLSEDNHPCGRYGDRTISKYRQMAGDFSGPACPTGLVPSGKTLLENVVQDWLDEFERIQLMLVTSARLRQLHGD